MELQQQKKKLSKHSTPMIEFGEENEKEEKHTFLRFHLPIRHNSLPYPTVYSNL